ncbi:MAG: hypothetical protein AAF264_09150, partial [Pseudomonadota bacterium]
MILNGKYFVPPDGNTQEFKVLFQRLTAVGAGRPVDLEGLPHGPWTPDLLAEAITAIDANRKGIELRTVQLWFQDTQKGVSPENVSWLARIFGCGDPEATGDWQRELRASLSLLAENRRAARVQARTRVETAEEPITTPTEYRRLADRPRKTHRGGLAVWSERIFGLGGPLNLPASIFAGATALQFVAFFIGNHSITYVRADGIEKQVGFHWATNWTFLFMLFLPLFVIFAGDLVAFWRSRGRAALLPNAQASSAADGWVARVQRSGATFWAVLLICIVFAGLMQWVGARMLPLRAGVDEDDIDWASVALVRPDVVTIPEAIMLSGVAYLYMAVCFYLMFAGLILLYTLADDYWTISKGAARCKPLTGDVARKILDGLFRCSVAGMLMAICMIVQNRFLGSDALDVWAWLFADTASLWGGLPLNPSEAEYGFAMHYTSLIVALPTCTVMIYGIVRVGVPARQNDVSFRMAAALGVIVAAYLLV